MADEELEWLARSKRRAAMILLVLGAVLAIGSGTGLVFLRDYQQDVSIPSYDMGDGTRSPAVVVHKGLDPRIIAGSGTAIGVLLAAAGVVLFVRARRTSRD